MEGVTGTEQAVTSILTPTLWAWSYRISIPQTKKEVALSHGPGALGGSVRA